MRLIALLASSMTVVLVCAASPAVAQTVQRPCISAYDPDVSIEFDGAVAAGRDATLTVSAPAGARLMVAAADPSRPISSPFDVTFSAPVKKHERLVSTAAGDGMIRATLVWVSSDDVYVGGGEYRSQPCVSSESADLTLREPIPITVQAYTAVAERTRLKFDFMPGRAECSEYEVGAVALRISGPGGAETIEVDDVCSDERPDRSGRNTNFGLGFDAYEGVVTFAETARRKNSRRLYRYRATVRGRIVSRGSFVVRTTYRPGRKVWTQTDEYWNYCVNEARPVYAQNGNFYCFRPRTLEQSIRLRGAG